MLHMHLTSTLSNRLRGSCLSIPQQQALALCYLLASSVVIWVFFLVLTMHVFLLLSYRAQGFHRRVKCGVLA
jgi:hypothetical protein